MKPNAALASFHDYSIDLAGALRRLPGVDEVLSTLLSNYIAVLFCTYLANGPLRDPTRQSGSTAAVHDLTGHLFGKGSDEAVRSLVDPYGAGERCPGGRPR